MSNYLINIDQKSRTVRNRNRIKDALGALLIIALVAAGGISVNSANADAVALPDQALMISPDFADYMTRYGNGMIFTDMDVQ